jgi:hypothetical protein
MRILNTTNTVAYFWGKWRALLNNFWIFAAAAATCLMFAAPAWADTGGITAVTVDTLGSDLKTIATQYLMPLGAICILVTLIWTAFLMILSAHKPEERAKAMGSLPYIIGGGLLLGGALLVAGVIVNMWGVFPTS